MIVKKFLHSCILLEDHGKRLLIDPGDFVFREGRISPQDIGGVDVILFTHGHHDHFFPEALKIILKSKPAVVLAHEEIAKVLIQEGITYESISAGEKKIVEGFEVEAFSAPHGPSTTVPAPFNMAYKIDNTVLHPGDCITLGGVIAPVLALPVVGSWMRVVDAIEFAKRVKPRQAIPIHDVFIKESFLKFFYESYEKRLGEAGIDFVRMESGKEIKI